MNRSSLSTPDLVGRIFKSLPPSRACNLPATLYSFPGETGPRWLVPPGANLNRVLENWSPYKLSSRLKWHVIRSARGLGVSALLPGVERLSLDNLCGVNWRELGWPLGTPPVPVIYVGTPSPQQKAILHLVDPSSGQCHGVVKVPLSDGARQSILRESDVLTVLEDDLCRAAPSMLFTDREIGVAAQEFVPGRSGSRQFLPEYWNLLGSLVLPEERTTIAGHVAAWYGHPLWDCLDGPVLKLLASAFAEQSDTQSLPACWVHGDFAPWNIRRRNKRGPALIDWEMAERAGLPLQDAYHFFHMQDFLFGGHPTVHAAHVEPFAKTLGLTSTAAARLEIAYLSQSYFQCVAGEDTRRSDFLLKTLTAALEARSRSAAFVTAQQGRLRLVSSHAPEQQAVRAQLLTAVETELQRQNVTYCLLSGYEAAAAAAGSDVDVQVAPAALGSVPSILARSARSAGALLVQSIAHETCAEYFVLAKAAGKHVAHLAVDCYGDYRRDGRTWLRAETLTANRRKYQNSYRPSLPDEFIYRLIKKVLKQSLSVEALKQLQHLFARNADGCRQQLARYWQPPFADDIERALVGQNLRWFNEVLPELEAALLDSPNVDGRLVRLLNRVREATRLLRRILRPTGMLVAIESGAHIPPEELANRMACSLSSVFRRVQTLGPSNRLSSRLKRAWQIRKARIRSTLVIEAVEPNWRWLAKWLRPRPDLVLQLRSESMKAGHAEHTRRDNAVALDAERPIASLTEQANLAVLRWLARRTATRLRLPNASLESDSQPVAQRARASVEYESVGSD